MKRVMILGYGVSGQAAARLASACGNEVLVVDERPLAKLPESIQKWDSVCGWTPETLLPKCDLAVISPGISIFSPLAEAVRSSGIKIVGELEFASVGLPCPFLAVTGTNGKTTTTELTTAFLRSAGYRCDSAGNIGAAFSDAAYDLKTGHRKLDVLVVETSSFQLESMEEYHPRAAALLNLASDHINRHGSMQGYADAKFRIFRSPALSGDCCILGSSLKKQWDCHCPGKVPCTFSATDRSADFAMIDGWICFHGKPVLKRAECPLEGAHNTENLMAALALLKAFAGEDALFQDNIRETAAGFRPDSHRMECFAEKNGIRFIDDSKATNPHSVNAALKTLGGKKNVVLLLGGSDKDMDFSSIAEDAGCVKCAILFGQTGPKIGQCLNRAFPCIPSDSFEDAVEKACANAGSGDLVLLSPACASFDQFSGYKARGERFQELVRKQIGC